jgi:hypothetical protein
MFKANHAPMLHQHELVGDVGPVESRFGAFDEGVLVDAR